MKNAVRAGDRSLEATNPTPSDFRRSRLETFPWDEERSSSRRRVAAGDQSHLFGAEDGETAGDGDVAATLYQGPIAYLDIVLRPRGRVGPPGRPRTFSGIRHGRSNRNAVKMAPRQRPSPTTQSIVEKQKDVGIRAFSAKPFTGAASVMPKSGTGILPVITGHHRQDADAT